MPERQRERARRPLRPSLKSGSSFWRRSRAQGGGAPQSSSAVEGIRCAGRRAGTLNSGPLVLCADAARRPALPAAETEPRGASLTAIRATVAHLSPRRFHLAGFGDRGRRTGSKAVRGIRPGSRERQNEAGYRGRSHEGEGAAGTPPTSIFPTRLRFRILG
jgi:hypothetical protein